jgi:ethanolamine utilization protein EutA
LQVAQADGIPLTLGGQLSEEDEQRLTRAFVDVLLGCIETGRVPEPYPADLLLVDDRPAGVQPGVVSFSGGVGEYIYGRETRSFGDVAPSLAEELRRAMSAGRLPMRVVGSRNHIRATVIGASQFSVQISGNTVGLSGASVLPLRNVPVLSPKITLGADMDADAVGAAVEAAARKFDVFPDGHAVAVALRWEGAPEYSRLRALAEGLAKGVASQLEARQPLVVLLDGDVARSLGLLLADELQVLQPVICLDGVKLEEFDYVDIGEIVQPAGAVPLVIKSLLFAHNEPVVPGIGVLAR